MYNIYIYINSKIPQMNDEHPIQWTSRSAPRNSRHGEDFALVAHGQALAGHPGVEHCRVDQ